MAFPLATAVRVAVSINRMTTAIGASIFVVAGIYQLVTQLSEHRKRKARDSTHYPQS